MKGSFRLGLISTLVLLTGNAFASDVQVVNERAAKVELEHAVSSTRSLKETAEGLLVSLIDKATQVGDFVADQVPKVIKELLIFNTVKYAVFVSVGATGFLWGVLYVLPWAAKNCENSDGISYVPLVLVLVSSGFWTLSWLLDFLQILLAPRVWLIEYAAHLVK